MNMTSRMGRNFKRNIFWVFDMRKALTFIAHKIKMHVHISSTECPLWVEAAKMLQLLAEDAFDGATRLAGGIAETGGPLQGG